jgi:hypothetical protein
MLPSTLLCFVILASGELKAGGIVVWKEQSYHADASARAMAFDRMKSAGPVTLFYSGKFQRGFEKHQIYSYIEFNERTPEEILKQEGLDSLKNRYAALSSFARRYPNAGVLMKARLEHMRAVSEEFNTGTIQVDGKWVPIAEYEQQIYRTKKAVRQREEAEAEQRQSELREEAALRTKWISGAVVTAFGLLLLVLVLRRPKLALAVLLPLALGAGWLTYKDGGFGWAEELQAKIAELMENPQMPWP